MKYYLKTDVIARSKTKKVYGRAGDEVFLIEKRDKVWLVSLKGQDGFPTNEENIQIK